MTFLTWFTTVGLEWVKFMTPGSSSRMLTRDVHQWFPALNVTNRMRRQSDRAASSSVTLMIGQLESTFCPVTRSVAQKTVSVLTVEHPYGKLTWLLSLQSSHEFSLMF
jgi:hypothetical protein